MTRRKRAQTSSPIRDALLTGFRHDTLLERKAVCTSNSIEHRFHEVRRTRSKRVFQDRTLMARILFAVFSHENHSQGISSRLALA
jgi:hypothetical protein